MVKREGSTAYPPLILLRRPADLVNFDVEYASAQVRQMVLAELLSWSYLWLMLPVDLLRRGRGVPSSG